MNDAQRRRLINAACNARQFAYAPYSKFQVGAAVLTDSGEVFVGCNVENASYGLTVCAERVAAFAAVAAGHPTIAAVAVATSGGDSPCGACRQVLAEFGADMTVLLVNADDSSESPEFRETTLGKLLPEQFKLE